MISNWLHALRMKFLLASVISVVVGLSVTYWKMGHIDYVNSILTIVGVTSLHCSIDLLNDYWDYNRGIDKDTKKTKFSGGSGVLPNKLLSPKSVYVAGMIFLCIGSIIGVYFVAIRGIVIAIILVFAILSVYFYSTKVVNVGLGELFIIIKGTLIVQGAYYVQTSLLSFTAVYNGIIVGLFSAIVLFANSFPDFDADKLHGRRTLVILLGRQRGARFFIVFILVPYILITIGTFTGYTKLSSLVCLSTLPLAVRGIMTLNRDFITERSLLTVMSNTIWCSRLTGGLLALSLIM
jgi:1,4-dihydroxy-2-naphthoate octaprenyltransferase